MKKLIFFAALLICFSSQAQLVTGDVLTFIPYQTSRIHQSDSVCMSAVLTSNKTVSNIVWAQTAGPAIKIPPSAPTYGNGNATAISSFWLQGVAPGTYVFKATGTTISGSIAYAIDSLVVVADPPKLVCPVIPPQRVATSLQIVINGQLITIPLAGTKIVYSDGSTQ